MDKNTSFCKKRKGGKKAEKMRKSGKLGENWGKISGKAERHRKQQKMRKIPPKKAEMGTLILSSLLIEL